LTYRSREEVDRDLPRSLHDRVRVFGGAVRGILLSRALPPHHVSTDSKDTVRMGMGLVATIAAHVLGLLIFSAKGFYDGRVPN
jgi:hypothetical protein